MNKESQRGELLVLSVQMGFWSAFLIEETINKQRERWVVMYVSTVYKLVKYIEIVEFILVDKIRLVIFD